MTFFVPIYNVQTPQRSSWSQLSTAASSCSLPRGEGAVRGALHAVLQQGNVEHTGATWIDVDLYGLCVADGHILDDLYIS